MGKRRGCPALLIQNVEVEKSDCSLLNEHRVSVDRLKVDQYVDQIHFVVVVAEIVELQVVWLLESIRWLGCDRRVLVAVVYDGQGHIRDDLCLLKYICSGEDEPHQSRRPQRHGSDIRPSRRVRLCWIVQEEK